MNFCLIPFVLLSNCFYGDILPVYKDFNLFFESFNCYLKQKGFPSYSTNQIEFCRIIDGLEGDSYYYYDFIDENGFILVNETNDRIVLFDTSSDIPYLRSNNPVCYSDLSFITPSGVLSWKKESVEENPDCDNFQPGVFVEGYTDPIEYGDISDLMTTKYSGILGWYINDYGKLPYLSSSMNTEGFRQWLESVYKKYNNDTGNWMSEKNCSITAIANVFAYYS